MKVVRVYRKLGTMLHVLTPLYATGTIVMLTLVFETVLGGKKCSLDQYINKNGKCRYCKFCPAGEGMNFTAQVQWVDFEFNNQHVLYP